MRTNKIALEGWKVDNWTQFLELFSLLKDAWVKRVREVERRIADGMMSVYGYMGQHEIARLQAVLREARLNVDSVAATEIQMREVFAGYQQSADQASKARVRLAANVALTSLADWPAQNF